MPDRPYIGRFAPTPSGPLHFGSVLAALAGFLDARSQKGLWRLRIDDLDTPRIAPGSVDSIFSDLDKLGLEWDGEIAYQSDRLEDYQTALDALIHADLVYPCICPRKATRGKAYPGTCRDKTIHPDARQAIRVKLSKHHITFVDLIQGVQNHRMDKLSGDFIIKRSDGLFAYHLAVVVDDSIDSITHIVRGADLLEATPCQIFLQQTLDYPLPVYSHIPVAINAEGNKLSKQHGTEAALAVHSTEEVLYHGLMFLGMMPDPELLHGHQSEILNWAISNWDINRISDISTHKPCFST